MAKFIVECSSPEAEVLLKKRPDISAFVKRLRRLAEENMADYDRKSLSDQAQAA